MIRYPEYAFIPRNLEIPAFPELSIFPWNVLFARFKADASGLKGYSAEYVPDIRTFRAGPEEAVMDYKNELDPRFHLEITYNKATGSYRGDRFKEAMLKATSFGRDWHGFFIQLGIVGLLDGEMAHIQDCQDKTMQA